MSGFPPTGALNFVGLNNIQTRRATRGEWIFGTPFIIPRNENQSDMGNITALGKKMIGFYIELLFFPFK